MFPSDDILIARGKYSTLGKERREQLEIVRKTAAHLMGLCQQAMNGVQAEQADLRAIGDMPADLEVLHDAAALAVSLGELMKELKEKAWGK